MRMKELFNFNDCPSPPSPCPIPPIYEGGMGHLILGEERVNILETYNCNINMHIFT